MEALWRLGPVSVREIQETFPEVRRPAFTTVQTTVVRLERKAVVRRVRKIGNAFIFAAAVSREAAQHRLIDDLLSLFGGKVKLVMARLIESGKLTADDVEEARKMVRELAKQDPTKKGKA